MSKSTKVLRFIFSQSGSIPRWIIFSFDLLICAFAFVFAVTFLNSFRINEITLFSILGVLPYILLIKALFMLYYRLYAGIIRHTGIQDGVRVLYTTLSGSIGILIIDILYRNFNPEHTSFIAYSTLILDFVLSTFLLGAFRVFIKLVYMRISYSNSNQVKTVYAIFGAGEKGLITKKKIDQQRSLNGRVIAFFDDNSKKSHKSLDGVDIFHFDHDFEMVIKRYNIDNLIIAATDISRSRKQDIIERCLALNVNVRTVPPVEKWINGELSFNQIKNVRIEDLIERDIIELDTDGIREQVSGKVLMVTGAAGSIGSEILNQLIKFNPSKLIAVDSSEFKLYELENDLNEHNKQAYFKFIQIVVADICNENRMRMLFEKYRPQIVYHAAAYKHVPLMERNPSEAIKTNVGGTKNLADLAVEYDVEKFVMVSTDKAVNPTNVMGASKRIAEIYVQSLNNHIATNNLGKTRFITTRFGNVLGSSGSVIPKFRKQIEDGGPITVTHPEITRFFMTIPEACSLVLEAGYMGKGGEIYVFDMGKSVKIIDLAKKMIKLSGLTLGKDIQIVYSGLRPGEKIYEELLNDEENTMPTHHPKIMIGQIRQYRFEQINKQIEDLLGLYNEQNQMLIVSKMKDIVPEFLSKNSEYEQLDKKVKLSQITVDKLLSKQGL